jgi:hypothetical protein
VWADENTEVPVGPVVADGAGRRGRRPGRRRTRVPDHLARLLPDARNAVVVAGPVVPGTRAAQLFVVEPEPGRALAKALHAEGGWCAVVPSDGERVLR